MTAAAAANATGSPSESPTEAPDAGPAADPPSGAPDAGPPTGPGRSPAIELGVRAATPLAVLMAAYLFLAGHNHPGGGFAAGLVIGAVIGLRMMAGMGFPNRPFRFLAAGAIVAGTTALAPLLWGDTFFDQLVIHGDVPLLGEVEIGTATAFDAGVVLIVVGLMVAVLDGLGADELYPTERQRLERNGELDLRMVEEEAP